jgi:hypothetical protein
MNRSFVPVEANDCADRVHFVGDCMLNERRVKPDWRIPTDGKQEMMTRNILANRFSLQEWAAKRVNRDRIARRKNNEDFPKTADYNAICLAS